MLKMVILDKFLCPYSEVQREVSQSKSQLKPIKNLETCPILIQRSYTELIIACLKEQAFKGSWFQAIITWSWAVLTVGCNLGLQGFRGSSPHGE